jgi:uncharacterized protein
LAELSPVVYLDSSALIKLVVPEPETDELRAEVARWDRHASSAIARTEVVRAATRIDPAARELARGVVGAISLIAVTDEILDRAAELGPTTLRSLDALHVASALTLDAALGSFVTYDVRQADAAAAAGLEVRAPR